MDIRRKVQILSTLQDIEQASTSDDVVEAFAEFVGSFGFTSIAISQFANPARIPLDQRISVSTWPQEYAALRSLNPEEIHDPIISFALRSRKPFLWREAFDHADTYGKQMMNVARDFDMGDGIVFPIHSTDSLPGGVSLSGDTSEISEMDKSELYLTAIQTYMKLEKLLGPFPFDIEVNLSKREKEVLHWAAAGKSKWEISQILSLSEKTIEHYISAARKKLNAVNTTHAVSTAISKELIMP